VLSGLLVSLEGDRLDITGSDLDLTITVSIQVAGETDGRSVIPAKLLSEIVRSLAPGAIYVEATGDSTVISGGRSQFSVHTISSEEFPQLTVPDGASVTMDAAHLAEGLRQVVPAASADESRIILTGVLLAAEGDGLRLVATDSYRLAVRDLPGESIFAEEQQVLVPSRALAELLRSLPSASEVTLVFGEQEARFEIGSAQIITRLIVGDFPNYRSLIPRNQPNRLVVDRQGLLDAVRRVKLLARESTPVRLAMKDGSLELVAVTQDVGQAQEEIDAEFTGEELVVAFNPEYLASGLEAASGDLVSLETVDALKPAVLRSTENQEFLYLLMPVRVT
jgi:DNA polymerase-3 subunit beta